MTYSMLKVKLRKIMCFLNYTGGKGNNDIKHIHIENFFRLTKMTQFAGLEYR